MEFATYITILNYDNQTKILFFTNDTNQGLRTTLSYQASPSETFNKFAQLYIKLDNHARFLRTPKTTCLVATMAPKPVHSYTSTALWMALGPMDLSLADKTFKKHAPLTNV